MGWRFTHDGLWCAGIAAAMIGLLAFAPTNAQATPLGLHSTHPGDITTHFTDVHYTLDSNPATGTLTAVGFPDEFDVNTQGFISSSFSLTLKINRATGAPLGGNLSITGETDGTPHFNGDLLEGNITQFGFHDPPITTPGVGNIFEFFINVNSGLLLEPGDYYASHRAGVIMNIANGSGSPSFNGTFLTPFANDGFSGFSDTFPTPLPEPSSFVLLGLALAFFACRSWRGIRRHT